MTKHSWIAAAVGAVVLATVCTLAWWTYRESQKRELERDVVAVVEDSTTRLREALGLLAAGPEVRTELEAHFAALDGSVGMTQALNASIHPALVQAAYAYVTDAQALLRRQLALHAGRDAVRADIDELNNHLRTASTRSPEWIHQALALKQRLEKSFFDFRVAAGGLEKSLHNLGDTSLRLQIFVPPAAIIENDPILAAEKRLADLSAQVEHQVQSARNLPAAG
jgi:hypothetical protein